MVERLDEQKLELLRRWGEGLVGDPREELRAAGRAILILIEEIERLQVDLWNERGWRERVRVTKGRCVSRPARDGLAL